MLKLQEIFGFLQETDLRCLLFSNDELHFFQRLIPFMKSVLSIK